MTESYADRVKRCADEGCSEPIPNGAIEHAVVLISNLVSHANRMLRIFSGSLPEGIYDHGLVVRSLEDFLSRSPKRKIEILLQDVSEAEEVGARKTISRLLRKYRTQCDVRVVADKHQNIKEHFVVMDEVGYRYCPDKSQMIAIGVFNDPEGAANLVEQFTYLFEQGRTLPVLPAGGVATT